MSDVIVTLASCERTHQLHKDIKMLEHILHVGMTSLPCDRLEEAGILLPMIKPGHDIVQLVSDFRFANTFYQWKSFIAIFDDQVPMELENKLYKVMAKDATISMFRLNKE